MAELREQMKTKDAKMRSEYKDLSQGIGSQADEVKLKAMESLHRGRLESASNVFRLFIILFITLPFEFKLIINYCI
jgi:hypothetical protein